MSKPSGNRASKVYCRSFPLLPTLLSMELDEALRFFTDDYERIERFRLVSAPPADAHAEIEQVRAWFEVGQGTPSFGVVRVIAVRGDRQALFHVRIGFDSGQGSEFLSVFAIDELGRARRAILFDLDDEEAALAELDLMSRRFEPPPS